MKMTSISHAFLALALASSFSLLTACEEKKPEGTTSTTSSPAEPNTKAAAPQNVADTPAAANPTPAPAAENAAGDGGHVEAAMTGDGGHATEVKGDGGHVTDPKKH